MDDNYRKYHEGREWIRGWWISPERKHDFAKFYAESDWDQPRAAAKEFLPAEWM